MTTSNRPDRRIGKTELSLPVFGLGAAHLGELYALVPEAQSQATLNGALDTGVSLLRHGSLVWPRAV